VLWIIFVATDSDALAWIAFAILLVVAVLGWTMFAIWWRRRQQGAAAQAVDPTMPPEQHFPVVVVAGHGVLAVTTVVLVFLAAIGVGD
jgi:heme/copper-type cytochrome/quinol oxidase subunit 2